MIKAIIFDCFGVLVGRGFDETYTMAGGDHEKDHQFIEQVLDKANRGQISHDEFHEAMAGRIGTTVEAFKQATVNAEQPNYELLDYIKTLRPKYKTAVLSNVAAGVLERKIDQKLLDECFDELVVSANTDYIKPEPEIYKLAAERLGVELDECIFTDDKERYVAPAQALGMKGIVYKDFAQFKVELENLLAADSN